FLEISRRVRPAPKGTAGANSRCWEIVLGPRPQKEQSMSHMKGLTRPATRQRIARGIMAIVALSALAGCGGPAYYAYDYNSGYYYGNGYDRSYYAQSYYYPRYDYYYYPRYDYHDRSANWQGTYDRK